MKLNTQNTKKLPSIPFTQAGYDEVAAKHQELTEERPNILTRLQAAREMGDLSENGAYHAARFELGNLDRELRRLTYQLRFGHVVASKGKGVVDFGSTVTIENDGKQMTFMLVNGYESNPQEKKLSTSSPIGAAVVGKKVGDTVIVSTPGGDRKFKIVTLA